MRLRGCDADDLYKVHTRPAHNAELTSSSALDHMYCAITSCRFVSGLKLTRPCHFQEGPDTWPDTGVTDCLVHSINFLRYSVTYEADARHRGKLTNTLVPSGSLTLLAQINFANLHSGTLDAKADVIVHQCNCLTIRPHEVSASTSDRFPFVDLYGKRTKTSQNSATDKTRSTPRTCVFAKPTPEVSGPIIACLMGQIAPGKATKYNLRPEDDDPCSKSKVFQVSIASVSWHVSKLR